MSSPEGVPASGWRPATRRWPSSPIRVTSSRAKHREPKKSSGPKWATETSRPHLESKIIIIKKQKQRLNSVIHSRPRQSNDPKKSTLIVMHFKFELNLKGFTWRRKRTDWTWSSRPSGRRTKAIIRARPASEDRKSRRNSRSPFSVNIIAITHQPGWKIQITFF